MSIFILLLFVILIIFIICAIVGIIRFWADTRKYSSYYTELINLKEKAEKRYFTEKKDEDKENDIC